MVFKGSALVALTPGLGVSGFTVWLQESVFFWGSRLGSFQREHDVRDFILAGAPLPEPKPYYTGLDDYPYYFAAPYYNYCI